MTEGKAAKAKDSKALMPAPPSQTQPDAEDGDAGQYFVANTGEQNDEHIEQLVTDVVDAFWLIPDDMAKVAKQVRVLSAGICPYVHRTRNQRSHLVRVGPPRAPSTWRTHCGWAFASTMFELTATPLGSKCRRCFKPQGGSTHQGAEEETTSTTTSASEGADAERVAILIPDAAYNANFVQHVQ